MASIGINAGGEIVAAFQAEGAKLILAGSIVTLLPVVVGYFFGSRVLRLNPALALGSVTGAMTSTPSLNALVSAARSDVPALGYAGTYTFANVMLTFAGSIMMLI
jgi:putative transport protein